MIYLDKLLQDLALNHLKDFGFLDKTQPTYVKEKDLERLINILNNTLTHFYSHYRLLFKSCIIQARVPTTDYYLRNEFSESNLNSVEEYKYIKDVPHNPFYPEVLNIEFIVDTEGDKLDKNNFHNNLCWFNLGHDGFEISNMHKNEYFSVHYLANHIPLTNSDYSTQEVNLAPFLLEAFKDYITYSLYNTKSGQLSLAQSQKFYTMYERKMTKVISSGLIVDYNYDSSTKLQNRGFI